MYLLNFFLLFRARNKAHVEVVGDEWGRVAPHGEKLLCGYGPCVHADVAGVDSVMFDQSQLC